MNLDRRIVEGITDLAKRFDIDKVILFGSRARGDNSEKSDIDLAVNATGDISDFIYGLETNINTLLEFDITVINDTLDGLFLEQIKKEGVVIYEKP